MKLLITLFLVSYSLSAQEVELNNELQITPIVIENASINVLDDVNVSLEFRNETILAKKKSYKNIIENTLSGRKHLIFKRKRCIKTC